MTQSRDRTIKSPLQVLFVTRESHADFRYGLGKSLTPVLDGLKQAGVQSQYLSQIHLSERNKVMINRFNQLILHLLKLIPNKATRLCLSSLTAGITERLNMGRLALKVAEKGAFSHIHCHDPFIAAGIFLFSLRQRPVVGVTQHGFGSYSQAIHEDGVPMPTSIMRMMRGWERRILRRCQWVTAPTQIGLRQLARDLAEYPLPTHWAAIPHPNPSLNRRPQSSARSDLGLDQDTFYILAVGRIVPLKDFDTLIRACGQITSDQKWRLVILGDGDKETLIELANDNGFDEGQLLIATTDNIEVWYSAADIYVSTSLTESFGMANHEAVCSGLPAILTAVGAVPEVSGGASYLIPSANAGALAKSIQELMDDPVLRKALAQRGVEMGECWPSAEEIANRYLACYQGHTTTISS